jgi:hypothetical protein
MTGINVECRTRPFVMRSTTMNRSLWLAALCFATTPACAGELAEIQAASIDLSGFRGVVYYTNETDGYRVVTTMSNGDTGLPVRFEATLLDGQKMTISVPGKLGEPTRALEVRRLQGKLVLAPPAAPEAIIAAQPNE